MNKHSILWKTSIFKWIQTLLCIVLLFVQISADIPNKDVSFEIFDELDDFQNKIYESMQETTNFFASQEFETIANFVPYLEHASAVALLIQGVISQQSDWKEKFAETVAHETRREIANGDLRWMEASMETLRRKFMLMDANNTDMDNRKTIASNFHTKIDKMLNFFAHRDSLFKKFPLLGAPLLIEFSLLIANFDPVVKALIPLEARSPEHSCVIRNILVDYQRRAINARLEKLHYNYNYEDHQFSTLERALDAVMSEEYNASGYDRSIRCEECIKNPRSTTACMVDDLGANYLLSQDCAEDYGLLIRHRVEKYFPIDLLDKICVDPPQATGFGWLTVKLRGVRANRQHDYIYCDVWTYKSTDCDPFVRLYINGEEQLETEYKEIWSYDVDVTFISQNISRDSEVKIEVWDFDAPGQADLVLRSEGNIDWFLKQGHRALRLKENFENHINTVSFWQDDYK